MKIEAGLGDRIYKLIFVVMFLIVYVFGCYCLGSLFVHRGDLPIGLQIFLKVFLGVFITLSVFVVFVLMSWLLSWLIKDDKNYFLKFTIQKLKRSIWG
jgi:hypothetical protein